MIETIIQHDTQTHTHTHTQHTHATRTHTQRQSLFSWCFLYVCRRYCRLLLKKSDVSSEYRKLRNSIIQYKPTLNQSMICRNSDEGITTFPPSLILYDNIIMDVSVGSLCVS